MDQVRRPAAAAAADELHGGRDAAATASSQPPPPPPPPPQGWGLPVCWVREDPVSGILDVCNVLGAATEWASTNLSLHLPWLSWLDDLPLYARRFHPWRSILTEIYLCHTVLVAKY
jgi:hypothetical protein